MHNVRLDQIEATAKAAVDDPTAAKLDVKLDGGWGRRGKPSNSPAS